MGGHLGFMCNDLRKRLGTSDINTVLQQNKIIWYKRVSREDKITG